MNPSIDWTRPLLAGGVWEKNSPALAVLCPDVFEEDWRKTLIDALYVRYTPTVKKKTIRAWIELISILSFGCFPFKFPFWRDIKYESIFNAILFYWTNKINKCCNRRPFFHGRLSISWKVIEYFWDLKYLYKKQLWIFVV